MEIARGPDEELVLVRAGAAVAARAGAGLRAEKSRRAGIVCRAGEGRKCQRCDDSEAYRKLVPASSPFTPHVAVGSKSAAAMQFIIQSLQTAFGGRVSLTVGLLLLGAIALQLLLLLFTTARRAWAESRADRLAARRLALQIREARIRCQEAEQARAVWNGYRKFTVQKKFRECDDVWSFCLVPHDGRPLPPFKPGQYLTFTLDIPGRDKPVVRCYSISDRPRSDLYRVTVKREKAPPDKPGVPPGVGSGYFCDTVREGD